MRLTFPPIAVAASPALPRLSPAMSPSPLDSAGSRLAQPRLKAAGRAGLKPPPGISERAPQVPGGPRRCETELIRRLMYGVTRTSRCRRRSALAFTALCGCGHAIGGFACAGCLESAGRGCLTCWLPGPQQHAGVCRVVLAAEVFPVPGPSP